MISKNIRGSNDFYLKKRLLCERDLYLKEIIEIQVWSKVLNKNKKVKYKWKNTHKFNFKILN